MSSPTHASFSLHTAYAPGVVPGGRVELDASEAAHLRAVRARPGDTLRVTDGRGGLWFARLDEATGSVAVCTLGEPASRSGPSSPPGWGTASARCGWWKRRWSWACGACSRWRRLAPARWPTPRAPRPSGARRSGGPWRRSSSPRREPSWRRSRWNGVSEVSVLVGPEGGWEPEDDAEAREAGFVEAGLAPRVLRFETAAIAALAVLAQAAEMPVNGDAESDRRLGGR